MMLRARAPNLPSLSAHQPARSRGCLPAALPRGSAAAAALAPLLVLVPPQLDAHAAAPAPSSLNITVPTDTSTRPSGVLLPEANIQPAPSLVDLNQPKASSPAPDAPGRSLRRASVLLPSDEAAQAIPEAPTTFPEMPPIQLPSFTEADLPNGLHLVLLEDHEVPIIRGTLLVRGGQYASPPDKIGLASLSLALQRGGGSEQYPSAVLDGNLENIAAQIETNAGQQAFVLSFLCPSEEVADVLRQFSTVLRSPALPPARLEFLKGQVRDALTHQYDDADVAAYRKLTQIMYGPSSIYARQPSFESINSITTEDIRGFLQKWERPDNAVMGIIGDFDAQAMLKDVQEALGDWQVVDGQPAEPPRVPLPEDPLAPAAQSAGKVFLVDRPGSTQATVFSGEPGVALQDPDATALDVLGGMLSSFGGTLFDQIRSREGLAYSVSGGWQSPPGHPGLFVASAETSQPGPLLKGLRRVLADTATQAPSPEVLDEAKELRLNRFVFDFSSRPLLLVRLLIYDLLGLPRDLPLRYKAGLESVDPPGLLAAARNHLHPDKQTTVIVADASTARPELEAAGFEVMPLKL